MEHIEQLGIEGKQIEIGVPQYQIQEEVSICSVPQYQIQEEVSICSVPQYQIQEVSTCKSTGKHVGLEMPPPPHTSHCTYGRGYACPLANLTFQCFQKFSKSLSACEHFDNIYEVSMCGCTGKLRAADPSLPSSTALGWLWL